MMPLVLESLINWNLELLPINHANEFGKPS
jgi:hypothetical protein